MPRNGLTKSSVIGAATLLIEKNGMEHFSMRALADFLNIKTASLYNHVQSMDDLIMGVCIHALQMQRETEIDSIGTKKGKEAIFALANAYRGFAKSHKELYRLILNTAVSSFDMLTEPSLCIVGPFLQVLEPYALSTEEKYHWQRIFRGTVHGFVSQEDAGFFSHLPVDVDVSFHKAIKCYIAGLEQAEQESNHEQ